MDIIQNFYDRKSLLLGMHWINFLVQIFTLRENVCQNAKKINYANKFYIMFVHQHNIKPLMCQDLWYNLFFGHQLHLTSKDYLHMYF